MTIQLSFFMKKENNTYFAFGTMKCPDSTLCQHYNTNQPHLDTIHLDPNKNRIGYTKGRPTPSIETTHSMYAISTTSKTEIASCSKQ